MLKAVGLRTSSIQMATAGRRLRTDLPGDGLAGFATWARNNAGLTDARALLAGIARAAGPGDAVTVAVEGAGRTQIHTAPDGPLGAIAPTETDTPPDLILRDLRHSRVTG